MASNNTTDGKTDTELITDLQSSVLELKDGRVMRVTTGLNVYFSSDGGFEWVEGTQVDDKEGLNQSAGFGLCRLNSGDVGLIYARTEEIPSFGKTTLSYFKVSSDEGLTWSEEIPIGYRGKNAFAFHDTITVCPSGRVVVPFREINSPQYTYPKLRPGMGSLNGVPIAVEGHAHKPEMDIGFVMYSDDDGQNWMQSQGSMVIWWEDGFGGMFPCDEPTIAPTRDGKLLMFIRTTLGVIFQSWSSDEGESWSMPEPTPLSSSYSPARLRTVPGNGDLICVWNQVSMSEIQKGGRRARLSSAVSQDNGQTWQYFKTIEVSGLDEDIIRVPAPEKPRFIRSFKEVGEIYKDWGMFSYANLNFADDKAFLEYEYRVGPTMGDENKKWFGGQHISWTVCGRKQRVLPTEWFYS